MIDFVNGKVAYQRPDYVVIEGGGLGYRVFVPRSLGADTGQSVMLFTHYAVKEDAHSLYGFMTEKERDFFRLLLEVSGVGPKMAMMILSSGNLNELTGAICGEDINFLTRLPGIGKKTAQRIVIDVKDKLKKWEGTSFTPSTNTGQQDVVAALLALGYNEEEAKRSTKEALTSSGASTLPVEDWILRALRVVAQK